MIHKLMEVRHVAQGLAVAVEDINLYRRLCDLV